ncbi:MAG: MFS transporter [Oscillospiraceae bacterium]|nr:MFS transporter [Oscillospiraceae bacterium]
MGEKTKSGLRLDYRQTILIGFGFMASSIAWGIYDPYVTTILDRLLGSSDTIVRWSAALAERFPILVEFMEAQGEEVALAGGGFTLVPLFIGIIMTFDNVFGVIFQPAFGKLSDRCHSRFGKRRPFILLGAPISALLFIAIPQAGLKMSSIPAMMVCIILFVFVMSLWRAPCVALMPDMTHPTLRSQGNAIINLTGGIGGLLALQAGTIICAVFSLNKETDAEQYIPYVFIFAAIVMMICTAVVFFFVPEPDSRLKVQAEGNIAAGKAAIRLAEKEAAKAEKARLKEIKLTKAERKSLIFMLACLFFLFCGANAIQTFFALFAAEILHKEVAEATAMMTLFGIATALGALPAGWLGKKLGRKKTILLGLSLFMAAFVAYLIVNKATGQGLSLVYVALILGGFANMMITVNTLPLVLEIGGLQKVGTFTGYYYTATFSAQIATPIAYGVVRMISQTYASLFVYCPVCFAVALLALLMVRHGEAEKIPDEVMEELTAND